MLALFVFIYGTVMTFRNGNYDIVTAGVTTPVESGSNIPSLVPIGKNISSKKEFHAFEKILEQFKLI